MIVNVMLTLNEVAIELKVSRRTIYRWIKNGNLPALKLNGIYRIDERDFYDFLREAKSKTSEEVAL